MALPSSLQTKWLRSPTRGLSTNHRSAPRRPSSGNCSVCASAGVRASSTILARRGARLLGRCRTVRWAAGIASVPKIPFPTHTTAMADNKQWFSETEALWPGQKFSLQMEEVLFQGKSDFQDVLVFKSSTYGNVLVLDGVIQCTERDEFSYQEMITHLPMFSHAAPKNVLIVGGGDFGVLREVAKHDTVEKIVMCEIDPMVCDVAKKFFTNSLAKNFTDPRLTLLHADAAAYLRDNTTEKFDVIIVDSSDPVGPAEVLFRAEFYENMKKSLAPNGIVCTQGECLWLHLDLIAEVLTRCHAFFPTVQYAYTTIPSYPSGQIGFVMCSLDESKTALVQPKRQPTPEVAETLRYYSTALHSAAFVLPTFAERKIAPVRKMGSN